MSVFTETSCRSFIRTQLAKFPKKGRGKLLELSKYLRIHPTALSQVLSGAKDFTEDQAVEVCEFLELSPIEAKYFRLLVRTENAGTQKLKRLLQRELEDVRKESRSSASRVEAKKELSDTEKAVFYSSWLYSACRLYCSTAESGRTIEDIVARTGLPRARALLIMEFLTSTGLAELRNDRYVMGSQSTFVNRESPFLAKHLLNWRMKAIQGIDSLSDEELMFTGPFSVSKSDFMLIREKLLGVIKEFSQTVNASGSEEVACLNIDLFHLWRD